MKATITLNIAVLAACAPMMAKHDVRYYLNGMLLTPELGTVRAVATDGHALATGLDAYSTWAGDQAPVIVPRALVEWALKNIKRGPVTIERDGDALTVRAGNGAAMTDARVDGKFPDWHRVMPVALTGAPPIMAADVMAAVVKCQQAIEKAGGGKRTGLYFVGAGRDKSAGWRLTDLAEGLDVGGVAMPMRSGSGLTPDTIYSGLWSTALAATEEPVQAAA